MIETLGLTAERCVELLDAREVSCRELMEAYLTRIEEHDAAVHAFLRVRRDEALAEADRLDAEGRSGLQGVPIALKDILCTRGEETTAGSRILAGHRAALRRRRRHSGQGGRAGADRQDQHG